MRCYFLICVLCVLNSYAQQTIPYRQSDGTEVRLPCRPQRVVVTNASLAKVWDLAGGAAVAAPAVKSREALPEAMRGLPNCGSAVMPDLERVLAFRPDLVLLADRMAAQRQMAEQLRGMGVAAVSLQYHNYEDFLGLLELFAHLNGRQLRDIPKAMQIRDEVAEVCRQSQGKASPSVAIVFASANGFQLEGGATNTGTMVRMLGGRNILGDKGAGHLPFSYEQFLVENPEVILVVSMGNAQALKRKFDAELASQSAWKMLKAAKTGRVHFLPPPLSLYTPGPDFPAAFRLLHQLLHAEEAQ
ncbi:MAG: ABC transporter substrate-binding protein [Victivallales bacterium]|nr:ABC transporter substrate-binding protein [Victivallales bacterium]